MTVEIRTQGVKPVRHTFGHIARRFGDKPASRYQEATYDLQSEVNHHYKPLWDPERDLYDKRRTAIVMKDWYALKDPRQYYYGSYTMARAKQQDALDQQMAFAEKRNLLRGLPEAARQLIGFAIVPLRHYEWGANMNLCQVSAYGWGAALTQAALMGTMDRLGMAQHLSRIGLLLDGNSGESLTLAKQLWLAHPDWQPLRREVERLFVTSDCMELLVAQALVADGLVYPFFYQQLDASLARSFGPGLSTVIDHLMRWQDETSKWTDAVIKTVVAESPENRTLVQGWVQQWRERFVAALQPLATTTLGEEGTQALQAVNTALGGRLSKLGLEA
jgi:phenol hydroxylase P1 protein